MGDNKNLRAVSDRLWAGLSSSFLLAGSLIIGIGHHIYLKTKMPSLS